MLSLYLQTKSFSLECIGYDMGKRDARVIELTREEWLSELLLAMWRQMGIRDIEEE